MNRKGHVKLGLIGFAIYVAALYYLKPFEINDTNMSIIVVGGMASALGSALPDLIEPSGDFRHRGFAHSRRVLNKLATIFLIFALLVLSAGLIGYILHLFADSTTKTGIPE